MIASFILLNSSSPGGALITSLMSISLVSNVWGVLSTKVHFSRYVGCLSTSRNLLYLQEACLSQGVIEVIDIGGPTIFNMVTLVWQHQSDSEGLLFDIQAEYEAVR